VRDLLAPQIGTLTREAVKTALLDDFATPWSVCRPPRRALNGTLTATVASIVMEPALGVMDVAPLPALGAEFTTYRLEPRRASAASTRLSPPAPATAATGR
jgi:isopenicillin-N N-acyltransferase like protein